MNENRLLRERIQEIQLLETLINRIIKNLFLNFKKFTNKEPNLARHLREILKL